jgi:hypothetical protein
MILMKEQGQKKIDETTITTSLQLELDYSVINET